MASGNKDLNGQYYQHLHFTMNLLININLGFFLDFYKYNFKMQCVKIFLMCTKFSSLSLIWIPKKCCVFSTNFLSWVLFFITRFPQFYS